MVDIEQAPGTEDPDVRTRRSRQNRLGVKVALVSAGLAAGVIGATAMGASATTGSGSTATSGSAPGISANSTVAPKAPAQGPGNDHGSAPVRSDEKAVSSSNAATLKAAALAAVPGGTVYRIETDAGDGVYEAHMTKADGTEVTVKFDKNLKVTKVEAGMGNGDPASAQGPGTQGSGTGH